MQFYDAFISYGRADSKVFATKLHKNLKTAGLHIWFDQEAIPFAVDFQEQINDGIEQAHNFLFIISPHAVNSPYCLKEIELAIKLNKRIIPLLHVEKISRETWQQRNVDQTEPDWQKFQQQGKNSIFPNMHPTIAKINWVYFREEIDNFDHSLAGLLSTINQHKDYVQQHTHLLVQGLEWLKNQKQTNYLLVGEERQKAEKWLTQKFTDEQPPCLPCDLHCEFICESTKNAQNLLSQVFLASSEEDVAIKEKIRKTLMRHSFTVWTSKVDIKTGISFPEAIKQGIEGADNFVYLISGNSLKSEYCQQELQQAIESNKRIILLLLENIDLKLIPAQFSELQFIDFTQSANAEKYQLNADKLLEELNQEYSYYETHKILLVKSRKWQRQNYNPSLLLRGYNLQYFEAWLKVAKHRENNPPLPLQTEFINASLAKPAEYSLEVFISYSRADSDLARKLNDSLQELGKTTWFDQESIATGTDFQQEIYRGIENSDNFLFIISPKSVNSPYCADEVEYAYKLNKRIFTILYRPLSAAEQQKLPSALAAVQWLDFNNHGGEFYANFNELVRTLNTDREHIKNHTKWSQRALEWQEKDKSADLLLRGSEFAVAKEWLKIAQREKKNPPPTDLQRKLISQSWEAIEAQKRQDKRQILVLRSLLAGAFVLLIAAIGASVIAVSKTFETEEALVMVEESEEEARKEAREAETAKKQTEKALVQAQESEKKAKQETENAEKQKQKAEIASQKAIQSQKKAEKQARIANQEKRKAEIATDKAKKSEQEAKKQATIANIAKQKAEIARNDANRSQKNAETQAIIARQQKAEAEKARNQAQKNEQEAKKQFKQAQLNQAESLGRYSLSLLRENEQLDAFIQAIKAGKILQSHNTKNSEAMNVLQTFLSKQIEINRLTMHTNYVLSVTFSSDGKTLASGSGDRTIKLWNIETGQEIYTLTGHNKAVWSVSMSQDGKILASSSSDNTIKLWNIQTGKEIRTLTGHNQRVYNVNFSPDGKILVSGSQDNSIKLWNVATGKEISTLKGHKSDVRSVSISPDGKTLASGSDDNTIKLWNLTTGQEIHTLKRHKRDINTVSFSPDGKTLASGSDDNYIKLWNVETGKEIATLRGHKGWVNSVSFSPDGKTLASASNDNTIKLWNLETDQEINTLQGHSHDVRNVSISPDGKTLASSSSDYTIKLWNIETGQEIPTIKGHNGDVNSLSITPDGKILASASDDNTIKLWNLATRHRIRTITGHRRDVKSVSLSQNGKILASSSYDRKIKLWNVSTGKEIHTLTGHTNNFIIVSISPDGKTLASGSGDRTIKLWNVSTGEEIHTLTGHKDYLLSLSFSPDGKTLASGSGDRKIKLWNVSTGEETRTLTGHNEQVRSVSFSPDGKTLVSGSSDKTIKLWHLKTGKEILTLTGHTDIVRTVSFSPDGKTLASGSEDNTIKIWNLKTGQKIHTLTGHNGWVNSISFTPDGQTLVSASEDNTIKLWYLPDLKLKLGLDYLMSYNCDLIRAYLLYNRRVNDSDRNLCNGIGRQK